MKAFITGSRAYGTPRLDSDLDLVIRCDEDTAAALRIAAATISKEGNTNFAGIRGPLNLILCDSDEKYDAWLKGTIELKAKAPVDRRAACVYLNEHYPITSSY
jgi:hypothetical protein